MIISIALRYLQCRKPLVSFIGPVFSINESFSEKSKNLSLDSCALCQFPAEPAERKMKGAGLSAEWTG